MVPIAPAREPSAAREPRLGGVLDDGPPTERLDLPTGASCRTVHHDDRSRLGVIAGGRLGGPQNVSGSKSQNTGRAPWAVWPPRGVEVKDGPRRRRPDDPSARSAMVEPPCRRDADRVRAPRCSANSARRRRPRPEEYTPVDHESTDARSSSRSGARGRTCRTAGRSGTREVSLGVECSIASITDPIVEAASASSTRSACRDLHPHVLESACIRYRPKPRSCSRASTSRAAILPLRGGAWGLRQRGGSWIAYASGTTGGSTSSRSTGGNPPQSPPPQAADDCSPSTLRAVFSPDAPIIRTFISLPAGVARMPFWASRSTPPRLLPGSHADRDRARGGRQLGIVEGLAALHRLRGLAMIALERSTCSCAAAAAGARAQAHPRRDGRGCCAGLKSSPSVDPGPRRAAADLLLRHVAILPWLLGWRTPMRSPSCASPPSRAPRRHASPVSGRGGRSPRRFASRPAGRASSRVVRHAALAVSLRARGRTAGTPVTIAAGLLAGSGARAGRYVRSGEDATTCSGSMPRGSASRRPPPRSRAYRERGDAGAARARGFRRADANVLSRTARCP